MRDGGIARALRHIRGRDNITDAMNFEQLNDLTVWRRMPTLDLDRIAAVRLMNRVDTKYIADEARCMELLELAADRYYVQIIGDCRACRYSTLYYDTPQWEMYHLHHNRRLTRQKVRTRTYVETGITYLEVKNKSNKGRTHKRRMALDRALFAAAATDSAAADFLRRESHYAPEVLSPSLATRFVRVTLVNHAMTERLTIDFDLHFDNVRAADCGCNATSADADATSSLTAVACGASASLGRLVIIELKQDALAPSPMKQILTQLRIKPFKLSKYCIGEALTNPLVKHNRFKAKIRAIDKMAAHDSNINDKL